MPAQGGEDRISWRVRTDRGAKNGARFELILPTDRAPALFAARNASCSTPRGLFSSPITHPWILNVEVKVHDSTVEHVFSIFTLEDAQHPDARRQFPAYCLNVAGPVTGLLAFEAGASPFSLRHVDLRPWAP
jgi:hypothetical protein